MDFKEGELYTLDFPVECIGIEGGMVRFKRNGMPKATSVQVSFISRTFDHIKQKISDADKSADMENY